MSEIFRYKQLMCRAPMADLVIQGARGEEVGSPTRLRATHRASWRLRLVSSRIILLPPRTKIVTALELGQPSITSMWSLVVPNDISLTCTASPELSLSVRCTISIA